MMSTGGGGDGVGGIGPVDPNYPAAHPAPPQVEDYGGPVLGAPKIVPIFFSNDDAETVASLTDFTNVIGATQYWTATTSEYGVGAAMSTGAIDLAETATGVIDDVDIQAWLGAKLNGDDPLFPVADSDTVYIIFYPAAATNTAQGGQGCQDFGGYHSDFALDAAHGSTEVAYAVVPRCPTFGRISGRDAITGPASHELVEAATDPYPMTSPAYALMDENHIYWLRPLGGGETGDMCAQFDGVFTTFPDLDYVAQRSWSNEAALAGHDPCQPVTDGSPYFNAVPVLQDTVHTTTFGQAVTYSGVNINVGDTKTIDIDLFSDADTGGPFNVSVEDLSGAFGGEPHLELSLDQSSGQNGQVLHLTIHVLSTGMHKTATFVLKSELFGKENLYFGVVGSPM